MGGIPANSVRRVAFLRVGTCVIAAMAVTTGLIHPDAHGGNLLYFKGVATDDVIFSWFDFGASSLN